MKRLLEQSMTRSNNPTPTAEETSSPSGRAICPRLGGVRQMLRGRLAASEQKLAESTQWLEMMGLSWNQTSQDTQVSPAEKLAQKIKNPKLKQIAKLAGRFKQIAERKRRSKAKDALAR